MSNVSIFRCLHLSPANKSRRGYAMGLFLVVLTVMTTTIVMMLSTAAKEARNTAQMSELTKARALASSSLDDFYARLQTTPDIIDDLQRGTSQPIVSDMILTGSSSRPWHYNDRGARVSCAGTDNLYRACYFLEIAFITASGETRPDALEITANVRYDCRGSVDRCRTVTFEQRIRAWQFTDFLFYTQYNVVSPSLRSVFPSRSIVQSNGVDPCAVPASGRVSSIGQSDCPTVAYTDNDKVTGPVYTADDFIVVCGRPSNIFTAASGGQTRVYARATNGQVLRNASTLRGDTCPTDWDPASFGTTLSAVLRLPPGRTTFNQAQLRATTSGSALRATGSTVSVVFNGNQVSVSGAGSTNSLTLSPLMKVITVDGDVELSGEIDGRVTVFASGNATIVGDLKYSNKTSDTGLGDVLGVNSIGDIIIEPISPKASDCTAANQPIRVVNALLVSLNGTVRTANLNVPTSPSITSTGCAPKLEFFGAMATKYQGVFGLYDSFSSQVLRGYSKNFSHDDRSTRSGVFLPPYLVTPVGLQWVRVDIAEVFDN